MTDKELDQLRREVRTLRGIAEQLTLQVRDLQAATKFNGAYEEQRISDQLADEPALWEKDR